jgi:hypothetical protein
MELHHQSIAPIAIPLHAAEGRSLKALQSNYHLPNDQTSDLLLNVACVIASGAAHLVAYSVLLDAIYTSSNTNLAIEKPASLTTLCSPTKQLLAPYVITSHTN